MLDSIFLWYNISWIRDILRIDCNNSNYNYIPKFIYITTDAIVHTFNNIDYDNIYPPVWL